MDLPNPSLSWGHKFKGETKKAIRHFKVAPEVAPSFNVAVQQFWIHFSAVGLLSNERRFVDAQTHVERAKSYADNNTYPSAYAMDQRVQLWATQHRFEEAKSEALRAGRV